MCVDRVYKYFRDFRKAVKCATMKIRITIKSVRVLNSAQCDKLSSAFISPPAQLTPNTRSKGLYLTYPWAFRSGIVAGREDRSGLGCEREVGNDVGNQVSKSTSFHHNWLTLNFPSFRLSW